MVELPDVLGAHRPPTNAADPPLDRDRRALRVLATFVSVLVLAALLVALLRAIRDAAVTGGLQDVGELLWIVPATVVVTAITATLMNRPRP